MTRRCRYPRIAKIGSTSQVSTRGVSESVAHCCALFPCYLGTETINVRNNEKGFRVKQLNSELMTDKARQ